MLKELYGNFVYDIKKNPFRVYFLISLINMIIFCAIFNHDDVRLFYRWGLCIWDVLFHGKISEYFLYTKQFDHIGNPWSVLIYVPLAIWNFPTWLLHEFNPDINLNSQIFLCWSKLFHVICLYVTAVYMRKILKYFKIDDIYGDLAVILCLGATSFAFSVGEAGQDETFYLMLFIIGLYNLFIANIKTAYSCFAWSIVCAPFMLLPAVAAILCKRFNIFKFLAVVATFMVSDKLFSYWWGYADRADKDISMDSGFRQYYSWFFEHVNFHTFIGNISGFAIVVILVLGICYLYPARSKRGQEQNIVAYSSVLMMAITLLCWNHTYRLCICMPFIILAIILSGALKKDLTTGFLLIFLFELTRAIMLLVRPSFYVPFFAYDNSPFSYINEVFGDHCVYLNMFLENEYLATLNNSAIYAVAAYMVFYVISKNRTKTKCNIPLELILDLYVAIPFFIISLYFGVFLCIKNGWIVLVI